MIYLRVSSFDEHIGGIVELSIGPAAPWFILAVMLFVQVLGLAVQVKRGGSGESTRLIRTWTVSTVAPLEKVIVWCQSGFGNLWSSYVYLRGVRQENRDLKFEIEQLRLEQVRLTEDAQQARRLQSLLGFKEQYIAKTVAAQVIGSSGSEQSRSVYIDKGTSNGVEKDMAVITADGVVGKILRAFGSTSQVLLISDQSSGVGAILDKSRLQGVVKGTAAGEVILENVMTDESVARAATTQTAFGGLADSTPQGRSDVHVWRNGESVHGARAVARSQSLRSTSPVRRSRRSCSRISRSRQSGTSFSRPTASARTRCSTLTTTARSCRARPWLISATRFSCRSRSASWRRTSR